MELEHRVKVLEQEVKILKNQIQATLLDIQAHILNEEYPILRAESAAQPSQPVQQPPLVEPSVVIPEVIPEASYNLPAFEDEPMDTAAPIIRKVSFKDLEEDELYLPPVAEPEEPEYYEPEFDAPAVYAAEGLVPQQQMPQQVWQQPQQPPSQPSSQPDHIDWATFTLLANWVSNSIEQMGVTRTEKLVKVYATKELLSPDLTSALLEFISLHDEDGSLAQPGVENTIQRISDGLGTLPMDMAHHPVNDHTREMILRLISGIQNIGLEEQHHG